MNDQAKHCTCPVSQWTGSEINDSTCELTEEEHQYMTTDQELREQAIKDVIEAIGAPSRESVTYWCAEFTASNSVKYAVEQRALVLKLQADKDKLKAALTELYAVVKGECPSLLDEDSGGYAQLDAQILAAIDQEKEGS